jgi:putative ABC transport system substrate-binding protein
MRRREFVALVSGAAAWPLAVRAQQAEQMRRIGVLMNRTADDPEGQATFAAFQQGLQQLGWSDGRNLRFDTRWGTNDVDRDRRDAAELVGLSPEVILAGGTPGVTALQRFTRSLPIVFVGVTDPVGAGLVDSLARPGGNVTGFMLFEYGSSGKWLELLKQIAPQLTRVAVLRDTTNPAGGAQLGAIQAAAQPLGVEVSPVIVRDPARWNTPFRSSPALRMVA